MRCILRSIFMVHGAIGTHIHDDVNDGVHENANPNPLIVIPWPLDAGHGQGRMLILGLDPN